MSDNMNGYTAPFLSVFGWMLACICLLLLPGCRPFCPSSRARCSTSCIDKVSGRGSEVYRELCRCDDQCTIYGDCCVDFQKNCIDPGDPRQISRLVRGSEFSDYFGCLSPIHDDPFHDNFVAVSRCPPDWPSDGIRNNCELTGADSDKFMEVLVNGPDNIVFKNIYCALCHGIKRDHLQPWSVQLWDCRASDEEDPPASRVPDVETCTQVDVAPPQSVSTDPHRCYQNYVDSCPSTSSGVTTNQYDILCTNHTAIVFTAVTKTAYKNIYCKICNNHSEEIPECSTGSRHRVSPEYTLNLVFDLDRSAVFSVETIVGRGPASSPTVLGNCSKTQMYDPFSSTCRNVSCPEGMQLQDEACVGPRLHGSLPVNNNLSLPGLLHGIDNSIEDLLLAIPDISGGTVRTYYERHSSVSRTNESTLVIVADFRSATVLVTLMDQAPVTNGGNLGELYFNVTSVRIVATSRTTVANDPWCEGYTVDNIQLNKVYFANNTCYINISGVLYYEEHFFQETNYNFDTKANTTNIKTSVTLCYPFVDGECPLITVSRDDFHVSNSNSSILVHTPSGHPFPVGEMWLLPNGSIHLCDFTPVTAPGKWPAFFSRLCLTGSTVSILALLSTLTSVLVLPDKRSHTGRSVVQLLVSLLLMQVFLPVNFVVSLTGWSKVVLVAIQRFSWLATFSWLTIVIYTLAFGSPSGPSGRAKWRACFSNPILLSSIAWGCPLVLMSSCVLRNMRSKSSDPGAVDGDTEHKIGGHLHPFLAVGMPGAVLLCINFAGVAIGSCTVLSRDSRRNTYQVPLTGTAMGNLLLCLKFLIVVGTNVVFFVVTSIADVTVVSLVSDVLKSLQGALVSLAFFSDANIRSRTLNQIKAARWNCSCCCGHRTDPSNMYACRDQSTAATISGAIDMDGQVGDRSTGSEVPLARL